MLVPVPVVVAAPLLIAWLSTLACDVTVSPGGVPTGGVPVTVTARPSGMNACDEPFSMLTATAAATSTAPSDDDAEGELSLPVPIVLALPPLSFDSSSLAILPATFF